MKSKVNNLRGQVATEFFLYTAVFMFVVIAAFFVVNSIQSTEIPLRENTIAKETGEFFSGSIALAVRAGKGFTYNYTFPRTVLGKPYTLSFSNDSKIMILDWRGRYGSFSQSYNLPPYNYYFPLTKSNCIDKDVKSVQTVGDVYILNSSKSNCLNVLTLYNDGSRLTVIHNAKAK